MQLIESLSLKLDVPPWSPILRFSTGYLVVAVYEFICRGRCPSGGLVLFFGLTLVMLRGVPLVMRRVIPFSREAHAVWGRRRRLARAFDSYQWQKLFWMGLGITAYTVTTPGAGPAAFTLAVGCVLAGGAGLWVWNRLVTADEVGRVSQT